MVNDVEKTAVRAVAPQEPEVALAVGGEASAVGAGDEKAKSKGAAAGKGVQVKKEKTESDSESLAQVNTTSESQSTHITLDPYDAGVQATMADMGFSLYDGVYSFNCTEPGVGLDSSWDTLQAGAGSGSGAQWTIFSSSPYAEIEDQ